MKVISSLATQSFKTFSLKFSHVAFVKPNRGRAVFFFPPSFPSSSAALFIYLIKGEQIMMTNLLKLSIANSNPWVIKQTDSIWFSPGTSAALQTQVTLAETFQVTRPLSHFRIRPLPPKQTHKKKTNRMKVGSMGESVGIIHFLRRKSTLWCAFPY